MTATLSLTRSMPGAAMEIEDHHTDWSILLDGRHVGRIAPNDAFETQLPAGSHTLQLT